MNCCVIKLCGLKKEEILKRLSVTKGIDAEFVVTENHLDARIEIKSNLSEHDFARLKSIVCNLFVDEVYSNVDDTLENIAVELLKINDKVLSVGESLTGGEVCSRLVGVPGVSSYFFEGIVCYNRGSKVGRLGVNRDTLSKCGAVSRETAYEMVKGLTSGRADIGLATTGLAGPSGDEGKPVGLVYIAVGEGNFITVFERHFSGDRNEIRMQATNVALFYLVRYLKGNIWRL